MRDILSFDEAMQRAAEYRKRSLLAGNGFSIAAAETSSHMERCSTEPILRQLVH
jgi:hypothetical protein